MNTPLNSSPTFLNDRSESWKALYDNLGRLLTIDEDHSDFNATWEQMMDAVAYLSQIESYWAYPGEGNFTKLTGMVRRKELNSARLTVRKIRKKLAAHREKYFEVLVLGATTSEQEVYRRLLRKVNGNGFVCKFVFVKTAEDALNATLLNVTLQAVITHDDAPLRSQDSQSDLLQPVVDELAAAYEVTPVFEHGPLLARQIKKLRPELDLYLVADSNVENIAARHGEAFMRIFRRGEDQGELFCAIMLGVKQRYEAPFFDAVVKHAGRPISNFHALPGARGKSVKKSAWIKDYEKVLGPALDLESSATTGGLDSLLEPKGPLQATQEALARAFGAKHSRLVLSGTTGANKIVMQALVTRGDVVLADRNCHKSIHNALMQADARVTYLEANKLDDHSIYGGVSMRELKRILLQYKRAGEIERVRVIALTNCTFDGIVYDPTKVMMECLAIAPHLVFLWDEAWFAFARFHHLYRSRTAMQGAKNLEEKFADSDYAALHKVFAAGFGAEAWEDEERVLDTPLLPDPAEARVRVYATQSMHKTLTALRGVSLIHIHDQDHDDERFNDAYLTQTTTSPSYLQLISADIGRRQAELEGHKLVQEQLENAVFVRQALNLPLLKKYVSVVDVVPGEFRQSSEDAYFEKTTLSKLGKAWRTDEFIQDPSRLTLCITAIGESGEAFKHALMKNSIQINKTTANTALFMLTIGNTRSDGANLIGFLRKIALDCEEKIGTARKIEKDFHA